MDFWKGTAIVKVRQGTRDKEFDRTAFFWW
jgi:hypothetical protein